jgi:hypothetical protein
MDGGGAAGAGAGQERHDTGELAGDAARGGARRRGQGQAGALRASFFRGEEDGRRKKNLTFSWNILFRV